jgi:hypothetical protein
VRPARSPFRQAAFAPGAAPNHGSLQSPTFLLFENQLVDALALGNQLVAAPAGEQRNVSDVDAPVLIPPDTLVETGLRPKAERRRHLAGQSGARRDVELPPDEARSQVRCDEPIHVGDERNPQKRHCKSVGRCAGSKRLLWMGHCDLDKPLHDREVLAVETVSADGFEETQHDFHNGTIVNWNDAPVERIGRKHLGGQRFDTVDGAAAVDKALT